MSEPFLCEIWRISISASPTNRRNFSYSIPWVIKSNNLKPTCAPFRTSHLLALPVKSSKRLFQSSTQACQSIFSQNQKVLNSASLFEVSEVPFQRNTTLHKKWRFPLKISSVDVTKSAGNFRIWSHFLKTSLMENFIFGAIQQWHYLLL